MSLRETQPTLSNTMSSDGLELPSLSVQRADIKSSLDLGLLGTLMTGMYTVIYFGTLYICLRGERSRNNFVIWTMSLLYACGVAECGVEWAFLHWSFLENGDTRANIFIALLTMPGWEHVMNNIFAFAMIILADMLLAWRCYHVWNQSIRIMLLPLLLFLAEVGLFLSTTIILFVTKAQPDPQQALLINRIGASGYFVSAATSLAITFLIAYRINSVTNHGFFATSGRFKNIVEIMVQSVLVYSVAQLVEAIAVVTPFSIENTSLFALENYSGTILLPITGIAPTIMVARVKLAAEKPDTETPSTRVTNLKFGSQGRTMDSSGAQDISHEISVEEKTGSESNTDIQVA